jgi:hypothetical protein
MVIDTLKILFDRDLQKLRMELELYKLESNIWRIERNISNSAGNLCLHLIGNLNTYIGGQIGKTNYVRNRDLEFSLKDVPRIELLSRIDATRQVVNHSLSKLTVEELQAEFPLLVLAERTSTEYILIHLATHLAYHLGQINYHRRLLD